MLIVYATSLLVPPTRRRAAGDGGRLLLCELTLLLVRRTGCVSCDAGAAGDSHVESVSPAERPDSPSHPLRLRVPIHPINLRARMSSSDSSESTCSQLTVADSVAVRVRGGGVW